MKQFASLGRSLTKLEQKKIFGGNEPVTGEIGGGCKDLCTTGQVCYIAGPLPTDPLTAGSCTGTENCNGTDGNKYIIKYCK